LHGTVHQTQPVRNVQRIPQSIRQSHNQRSIYGFDAARHTNHEKTIARFAQNARRSGAEKRLLRLGTVLATQTRIHSLLDTNGNADQTVSALHGPLRSTEFGRIEPHLVFVRRFSSLAKDLHPPEGAFGQEHRDEVGQRKEGEFLLLKSERCF
jgi:hypothetical protein